MESLPRITYLLLKLLKYTVRIRINMTKVQSGQVRKPLGVEMRIVLQCKILCVLHNVSDYSQERLRGRFKIKNTIICGKSP